MAGELAGLRVGILAARGVEQVELVAPRQAVEAAGAHTELISIGIFDVFLDDSGRDAHLSGKVVEALMAQAPVLFANPPKIEKIDVLATKLPT